VDLGRWLTGFKALHEKAKQGDLAGPELRDYRARRYEMERALLAAQDLTRPPGQQRRQSLRVARALQVELVRGGEKDRLTTFDVSMGGFAAPMASAPILGETLVATVRLPGVEPLVAPVKVVGARAQSGKVRVSFAFGKLEPVAAERLEHAIVDMVLAQFEA